MTISTLHVYIDKIFAGLLEQNTSGGGALSFTYDRHYLSLPHAQKLSIALPLQDQPFGDVVVRAFFSGLLPDDEQLNLVAKQLKTSARNPFAILSKIGRDCAGAIEILPPSEKPLAYGEGTSKKLTPDTLFAILNEVYANPLLIGGKRKVRLSLAGAQSKLAVSFNESADALPALVDGMPSTHILKPPMQHFPDSVFNEFFCMRLAKKAQLEVAEVLLKHVKDKPYLLIRRYDRSQNDEGYIKRIHQEDFCQALGLRPEMKYQGVDGGPSITTCRQLLMENSSQPAKDTATFIQAVIFNYLIGNADAHGKNFSFLYKDGQTRLAPLYDLVCTSAYPALTQTMAMKIGKVSHPSRVSLKGWHSLLFKSRSSELLLEKMLKSLPKTVKVAALDLKEDLKKEGIASPIFDTIIHIIDTRSTKINDFFK